MTHHPHLHMIGAGRRHLARRPALGVWPPKVLLPVPVLSRLFRKLSWPSSAPPTRPVTSSFLASTPTSMTPERSRRIWRRCARSSGTSTQSLRSVDPRRCSLIFSRYTHRVAISNRRLIASNHNGVHPPGTRIIAPMAARDTKSSRSARTSSSAAFASTCCRTASTASATTDCLPIATARPNIARARELLAVPSRLKEPETSEAAIDEPRVLLRPCPCCGGRMIIIETFARGCEPKHQPETTAPVIRIDTYDAVTADR